MSLTPRLDLRQSQSLVMTPQLQQAIKLLQLTNLELSAFVEQELEQNPLLERTEPGAPDINEVRGEGIDEVASDTLPQSEINTAQTADAAEILSRSAETGENIDGGQSMDADVDNDWSSDTPGDAPNPETPADRGMDQGGAMTGSGSGSSYGDDLPGIEQTLAQEESMREHLLTELGMIIDSPMERLIGVHLIDMLDEAGYVHGSLEKLAEQLGCGADEVEAVLIKLQGVEPAGLFARDLAECLALQLPAKGRLDPAIQAPTSTLDMLAKGAVKGFRTLFGVV